MATTRVQKEQMLKYLEAQLKDIRLAVFVDYRGMSVDSMNKLRSKLEEDNMTMKVAKKTLIGKAFETEGIKGYDDDMLSGPTAIAFGYDDSVALAKTLKNFTKEDENLKILGGVLNKEVVKLETIMKLADLPSREELLAKMVGSLKSPISGFVMSAKSPLNGFVQVLNSLKDQKESN